MRQLGRPQLLAATYSSNAPAAAVAAMEELEETLLGSLQELTRIGSGVGEWVRGLGRAAWGLERGDDRWRVHGERPGAACGGALPMP